MSLFSKPPAPEPDQAPADADAGVRFGASPDRLKVGVSRYTPARGAGKPLTVDLLRRALRDTGITAPLDEEHAAEVVRLLLEGKDVSHIVVARGVRPQNAQDARLELCAELERPVFPGQVVGSLFPAVQAQEGRDVAGNAVPPEDPREPRVLTAMGGLAQDRDGVLTAKSSGVLSLTEQGVVLAPLVRVSADKLQATATLHHKDALGAEITPEGLVVALAAQGISCGIQLDRIVAALAQARDTRKPVEGALLAQGQAPVHGENGRLEVLCGDHACAEPPDENARIDYRDRGLFPVAAQGATIARLHPPTKGVAGRDIYGIVVPARDGAPLRLVTGKNVEPQEGGTSFRARMAGVVLT